MRFKPLLAILAAAPLLASPVRIYVTNSDDNKITVVDPATDRPHPAARRPGRSPSVDPGDILTRHRDLAGP